MLQEIQLFIQWDRQTDGGGGQQIAQILCTGIVDVIVHIGNQKQDDGNENGNQQGIKEGTIPLLLQKTAETIGHQTDCDPNESGGFQKRCHLILPAFL